MPRILNKRIIVFCVIAFCLGIFVGGLIFSNLYLTIIIPIALLLLGIIFYLFFKKILLLVLLFTFSLGCVSYVIDYKINVKEIDKTCEISGKVVESVGKNLVLSDLTIEGKKYGGKVLLKRSEAKVGEQITYFGAIKTMDFSVFDTYAMSYYNDDVFYESTQFYSKEISKAELDIFEKIKGKITRVLSRYMADEDTGIVKSLLFGDKSSLRDEDNVLIRSAGVSHIFAVSGLHVGFLIALLIFVLKKLRINPTVQFFAVVLSILLYGFLCNFPGGLKRAGIMAIVYLLSSITCNKNDPLTTLSLSVFIILIINPLELFDLGFLMSVSAVFGITLFYKPIYKFLSFKFKNKIYLFVAGSVALTLSANIFLLPISFNVFNTFSVYMVLSNLIIVPLVTIAYSSIISVAFLSLIFEGFGIFYVPLKYTIIAIRAVCKVVDTLPFSTISLPSMGIFTAVYVASFVILSKFIMIKPKYKVISISGLVAASFFAFLLL